MWTKSFDGDQWCATGHLHTLRTLATSYLLPACLSAPQSDQGSQFQIMPETENLDYSFHTCEMPLVSYLMLVRFLIVRITGGEHISENWGSVYAM